MLSASLLLLALPASAVSPDAYLKKLDSLNQRCAAAPKTLAADFLRHHNGYMRDGHARLSVSKSFSDTQADIQAFFDSQGPIDAAGWTAIREKSGGTNVPRNQELIRCSVRLKDLRAELVLLDSATGGDCDGIPGHVAPLFKLVQESGAGLPASVTADSISRAYERRCRDAAFMKENASKLSSGGYWLSRDKAGRLVASEVKVPGWGDSLNAFGGGFFEGKQYKESFIGAGQGLLLAARDLALMLQAMGQQGQDVMNGKMMLDSLGKLYLIVSDPAKYQEEEVAKARELLKQWDEYRSKFHKAANAGDSRHVTAETVRWLSQAVAAFAGPKAMPKPARGPKSGPSAAASGPGPAPRPAPAGRAPSASRPAATAAAEPAPRAKRGREKRPGETAAEEGPLNASQAAKIRANGRLEAALMRPNVLKAGDALHGTSYANLRGILRGGMQGGPGTYGTGVYVQVVGKGSMRPGAALGKASGDTPVMLRVVEGNGIKLPKGNTFAGLVEDAKGPVIDLPQGNIRVFDPQFGVWKSLESFLRAYPTPKSYGEALAAGAR